MYRGFTGVAQKNTHAYSLDASFIRRINSSMLYFNSESISATAIVWDYVGDNVHILTNYHISNIVQYEEVFPPMHQKSGKKRKVHDDGDGDVITLSNESITMTFQLSSEIFLCYDKEKDYAVLQLSKAGFTMPRMPLLLMLEFFRKIHAFGYIGQSKELNVTHGEISWIIPYGFTTSLLTEYSGAAILCDDETGYAVGYTGRDVDASEAKNYRFDAVIRATKRSPCPTYSTSGKGVWKK